MNIKHIIPAPPPPQKCGLADKLPHTWSVTKRGIYPGLSRQVSNLFNKLFGVKLNRHFRPRHNCRAIKLAFNCHSRILLAGITFIFAIFTNQVLADHIAGHTEFDCMDTSNIECTAGGSLAAATTTLAVQGSVIHPGPYTYDVDDHPDAGDFDTAQIRTAPSGGQLRVRVAAGLLEYYPAVGTTSDSFVVVSAAGTDFTDIEFTITVNQPGETGSGTPVAQRKSRDNDFDNFAAATAIGMLATTAWLTIKNHNPTITNKIKFTAMPTSNKSLQYNLSTNINNNWRMNFTVDRSVKINSETNNSNLYELKFEYKF